MYSGRFFLTALLLLACTSSAFPQTDVTAANLTLQVASFPDTELANKFVVQLVKAGEHPVCATVELPGRGYWTRVFLGLFATPDAARRYGDNLKARRIIDEFLVRKTDLNQAVTRPTRVSPNSTTPTESVNKAADPKRVLSSSPSNPLIGNSSKPLAIKSNDNLDKADRAESKVLPVVRATPIAFAPPIDASRIPRPDPVSLAFKLIVGDLIPVTDSPREGGLWVTGDMAEGLSRLQWIAGEDNAASIKLDEHGRVELDKHLLAKAAGIGATRVGDPLQVAHYIASNEGLLLLVQLAEGNYRYLLHIGNQIPTRGRNIEISGGINLDNNYDSRINPYRKNRRKLEEERPPEGFASIVGLNPVAQWFNLSTHSWVPAGEITLHELAEAHAKVALGLDYLEQGPNPGAHGVAIERERRMKAQRPGADIVLTAGSNRVLKSQEEIRSFYAEVAADFGKQ